MSAFILIWSAFFCKLPDYMYTLISHMNALIAVANEKLLIYRGHLNPMNNDKHMDIRSSIH